GAPIRDQFPPPAAQQAHARVRTGRDLWSGPETPAGAGETLRIRGDGARRHGRRDRRGARLRPCAGREGARGGTAPPHYACGVATMVSMTSPKKEPSLI